MPGVVVVFTAKSVDRILAEGGTSSWRLDRNNARQCAFAVCTRNAHADWVEGPEDHHAAFLIGKVKDVVPAPDNPNRYCVQFSEFARVSIPDTWKGDRNPVKYAESLEELGIDPATLSFQPMPIPAKSIIASPSGESVRPLTLAQAKEGLALHFSVTPDAVEITIRG